MCVSHFAPDSAFTQPMHQLPQAKMILKLNLECEHKLLDEVNNLISLEAEGIWDVSVQLCIYGVFKKL